MDHLSCSLIIPAAGESKRFTDAGITKPKGLLELNWRGQTMTMLEHVIPRGWRDSVRVIVKQSQYSEFRDRLPIDIDVFPIAQSDGQAMTCRLGTLGVRDDLLIVNSDNAFDCDLVDFVRTMRSDNAMLGVVTFRSNQEIKYGYVSDHPHFDFGMEKAAISSYALAGAFYFKSATVMALAYAKFREETPERPGEKYLSELFQHVNGMKISWLIDRRQLHEWGTPIDLMADRSVCITDAQWTRDKAS